MAYVYVYNAFPFPTKKQSERHQNYFSSQGFREEVASLPLLDTNDAKTRLGLFVQRMVEAGYRDFTVLYPAGSNCSITLDNISKYGSIGVFFVSYPSLDSGRGASSPARNEAKPVFDVNGILSVESSSSSRTEKKRTGKKEKSRPEGKKAKAEKKVKAEPKIKVEPEKKEKKARQYTDEEYKSLLDAIENGSTTFDPTWIFPLVRSYLQKSHGELYTLFSQRLPKMESLEEKMEFILVSGKAFLPENFVTQEGFSVSEDTSPARKTLINIIKATTPRQPRTRKPHKKEESPVEESPEVPSEVTPVVPEVPATPEYPVSLITPTPVPSSDEGF